jgi:uncharacterized protein (DUF2141 family)
MKARTRLLLTGTIAALSFAGAQAQAACEGRPGGETVKLVVDGASLRAAKGEVAVTVYPDDVRRFLAKGGKLLRVRSPATQPVTRTCFWLPPGVYALAIYHDQNGNHDFDRDQFGRPIEGYGFSNDAPTHFSLPAFDAVRFRLPAGGRTLTVRMRYP